MDSPRIPVENRWCAARFLLSSNRIRSKVRFLFRGECGHETRPSSHLSSSPWRLARSSAGCSAAATARARSRRSKACAFSSMRSSKERDANREAATRLAALEASQLEREKGVRGADQGTDRGQGSAVGAVRRDRQQVARRGAGKRSSSAPTSASGSRRRTAGQNLKALLQPVHDRLERYEKTVQKVEDERRDAFRAARRPDRRDAHRARSASRPRRPSSSMRCATRPRRAAAGASSSFATCSRAAACPSIAISRPRSASSDGEGGAAAARRHRPGARRASRW